MESPIMFPLLRAHNMRTTILQSNETKIDKARLAELERKERAHDAYFRATQKMRARQGVIQDRSIEYDGNYRLGWLTALQEFATYVVEEDR